MVGPSREYFPFSLSASVDLLAATLSAFATTSYDSDACVLPLASVSTTTRHLQLAATSVWEGARAHLECSSISTSLSYCTPLWLQEGDLDRGIDVGFYSPNPVLTRVLRCFRMFVVTKVGEAADIAIEVSVSAYAFVRIGDRVVLTEEQQ